MPEIEKEQHSAEPKFSLLYEQWLETKGRVRQRIERRLDRMYQEAWSRGDLEDQNTTLCFLLLRRHQEGFPIIVEALKSASVEIASIAAAVASVLINEDFDLGDEIETAFEQFVQRFPDWEVTGYFALQKLRRRR